jgi:hypothetical protein
MGGAVIHNDIESMTDAEIAERQYRAHDAGELEDDEGETVQFDVAKPLLATISFRLPRDEAEAIQHAAKMADVSQSEWIRTVARAAISRLPLSGVLDSVAAKRLRTIRSIIDRLLIDAESDELETDTVLVEIKSTGRSDDMTDLLTALRRSVEAARDQAETSPDDKSSLAG